MSDQNSSGDKRPSVAILLSLYNGEAYLQQQLNSIQQQTYTDWALYWRDDGSTDSTLTLMRQFTHEVGAERCVEVTARKGEHLGVTGSYVTLLAQSPPHTALAFCDQDDVWFPDKLERGMAALASVSTSIPALYCTRQTLTNKTLHATSLSSALPESTSFLPAMTQNIATGCTIMLSPAACTLLRNAMPAPTFLLHDWWAYLMVTGAGGRVLTDNQPSLFYRQHGKNAVGARSHFLHRALAALKRGPTAFMNIFRANTLYLLQRQALLTPDTVNALKRLQKTQRPGWPGFMARVSALCRLKQLRRHKMLENLVFRVWFLLG
ncbi:alpha-L-Rha alpha-1,3-L-rhamnosyltransferase [Acetobacter orleanensis]|nr:alpha-L-Rha alpha-1,3-L-rhamnosyltransferase [Acetobacter orleanensis]PCD79489.1 alpha-L-Rha alpha-1,3-L-rhamnosyltransferase [Acetobacter orleanensis]